jgi:hypothetical protein
MPQDPKDQGKKPPFPQVAPGPVWTPLVAQSFDREKLKEFGKNYPMERPAQPAELAPA